MASTSIGAGCITGKAPRPDGSSTSLGAAARAAGPVSVAPCTPHPLGNTQNRRPPQVSAADVILAERWAQRRLDREVLWGAAVPSHRVRTCGRSPLSRKGDRAAAAALVDTGGGRPYFAGVETCSSTWDCPVCMPGISAIRAVDIARGIGGWCQAGNSSVLVTFTPRHDMSMRLDPLLDVVSAACSHVFSGRPWRRMKDRLGIVGQIRASEVTCGCNGWHPHIHAIVAVEGDVGARGLADLTVYLRSAWRDFLVSRGFPAPSWSRGVDVQVCYSGEEAGAYIAKCQDGRSPGNELARIDLKNGKDGHRTYFQLVRDYRLHGRPGDLALIEEHQRATHGRRRIVWSQGLRDIIWCAAGDPVDVDRDDWLVTGPEADEPVPGGKRVLEFARDAWWVMTGFRGLEARILAAYMASGLPGVAALLAEFDLMVVPGISDTGLPRVVVPDLLTWQQPRDKGG